MRTGSANQVSRQPPAYVVGMANPRPRTRDVLSRNLRALMDRHEMSERALAQSSGVSQGQINNILNQRTSCSIETAEALAHVFGLTGWHLLLHGLPDELLSSPSISRMVDAYVRMNGEGRELIDAMIRREATRKR